MSVQDFGAGVPNASSDAYIQKNYPAVELNGTETPLGVYSETREVNGSVWRVINATYNSSIGGWQQVNAANASSALVFGANGLLLGCTVPAGTAAPIGWPLEVFGGFPIPIPVVDGGTGLASVGPNGYVLTSNGVGLSFQPIPSSAVFPFFNVMNAPFNAIGDGVTDDTPAFNACIAAIQAARGGTLYCPIPPVRYLISGALVVPYIGTSNITQYPMRWTSGSGPQWNGYWNTPGSTGAVLDLRYTGTDGLHPAKIDTRGAGFFEIDHLTLRSGGTDNFPIFQTTNTTIFAHHNCIQGNPNNDGNTCVQTAWGLGGNGYFATNAQIAAFSTLLTIGAGDPPFTPEMVNWTVSVTGAGAGGARLGALLTYASPTTATLSVAASTTVTGANANYYGFGYPDAVSPFQGYGTLLENNFYDRISVGVQFNLACNSVEVRNETYSLTCGGSGGNTGTSAPYNFNEAQGNRIYGATIETPYYGLAVYLATSPDNYFSGIGIYDNGTQLAGLIYAADGTSANNVYVGAAPGNVAAIFTGPGAASNVVFTSSTVLQSQVIGPFQAATRLGVSNGFLYGATWAYNANGPTGTGGNMTWDTGTGGSTAEVLATTFEVAAHASPSSPVFLVNTSVRPFMNTPVIASGALPGGVIAGTQGWSAKLLKPVWYNGTNWVDATGSTVVP